VNDVELARKLTYKTGTWLSLDAVHFAPHFTIDVQKLGCDFLLGSAYKFYGPHVGILYSKPGLLDNIPTDHLRTAGQSAPEKIETGTLNHAAIAGVSAAISFLESFGKGDNDRAKIMDAYQQIGTHERALAEKLWLGLGQISDITVVGTAFGKMKRAPTISFKHKRFSAEEVCKKLAAKNICAWDGHFYAQRAIEILGLLESGGVTRLGISAYNTADEIDSTLEALRGL
jgi:selenocysteine lyase/cysteine desulfurase